MVQALTPVSKPPFLILAVAVTLPPFLITCLDRIRDASWQPGTHCCLEPRLRCPKVSNLIPMDSQERDKPWRQ